MERENLRNQKIEGGLRTRGAFHKKLDPGKPLISIITVVRNGEKYLEQTIQSVLNQTYRNIEYIIIDGVSTDGTLDIIRKYEDRIAYWISEPDSGVYDAMNKGIKLSTGEIIGIINSDDWYEQGVIEKIARLYSENHFDYSFGNHRSIIGAFSKISKPRKIVGFEPKKLWGLPFCHPTCFVSKKVYELYGGFDQRYQLSADTEFFFRLFNLGLKGFYIDSVVANYRSGGRSSGYHVAKETTIISIRYGNNWIYAWGQYAIHYIKYLLTKVYYSFLIKTKYH